MKGTLMETLIVPFMAIHLSISLITNQLKCFDYGKSEEN